MERLILDTTVLVSAERTQTALKDAIAEDDDVVIAAITAAELLVGVHLASGKRKLARRAFVDAVLFTLPVQDYTLEVARAHAQLLADVRESGKPRGAHDLLIAATAVATDRILITGDALGFADLPSLSIRKA